MNTKTALGAALAIWLACATGRAMPTTSTTTNSTEDRLSRLERRFDEMEQKHAEEMKAKDDEIARLKTQLRQTGASEATKPSPGATVWMPTTAQQDEIEKTKQDVLKDIEAREVTEATIRVPANFNPDLAVIGDFVGNVSNDNANPARNRFDLRTLELELRAPVDPRADAVAVIPFSRDIDDPLFFDPAHANGSVDNNVEVEEGYLFLHDFGVPNLTTKLGRFHLRFGRQNVLHSHDWPTVDNNFVSQSFLGSESLNDSGASFSYVIPPDVIGGQYVEAIAEVITGEGNGSDGPVLNNTAFVDSPAVNTHLLWNHDFGKEWNLELGGSWLTGKHNDDNEQDVNLFGSDITLIHTDPTGGFFNQLFQAETIYGLVDASRVDHEHSFGAYLLAQQQLNRDWYAGVRLDWTKDALNEHREVWGVSPYITWYWSEFLRFRMEYQHKGGHTPKEDTLWLQATWVFGAHPPHPYWSMK